MQMKLIDCDGSLLFFSLENADLDFVNRRGPASHSLLAPFGAATVTGAPPQNSLKNSSRHRNSVTTAAGQETIAPGISPRNVGAILNRLFPHLRKHFSVRHDVGAEVGATIHSVHVL
jgi:hypothetical protein